MLCSCTARLQVFNQVPPKTVSWPYRDLIRQPWFPTLVMCRLAPNDTQRNVYVCVWAKCAENVLHGCVFYLGQFQMPFPPKSNMFPYVIDESNRSTCRQRHCAFEQKGCYGAYLRSFSKFKIAFDLYRPERPIAFHRDQCAVRHWAWSTSNCRFSLLEAALTSCACRRGCVW